MARPHSCDDSFAYLSRSVGVRGSVAALREEPHNGGMEERRSLIDERSAEEEAATDDDERGLRFEDPYWDDAFCAWWDPTLRTCC
jgi:hypothetical protein